MFRFTIRDLLWLTVVVALGVGWWVDRQRAAFRAAERERLWSDSVWVTAEDLSQRYRSHVQVVTPDGGIIGSGSGEMPDSQSQDQNMASK